MTRLALFATGLLSSLFILGCFSPGDCTVVEVADSSCLNQPTGASGGSGTQANPSDTDPAPTGDGPDADSTTGLIEQDTTTVNPMDTDPAPTSSPMDTDTDGSGSSSTTEGPKVCTDLTCADHPTLRGCTDESAPLTLGDLYDDLWAIDAAFTSCDCTDEQKQTKVGLLTCLGLGNADTNLSVTATSCDEQKIIDLIAAGPTQRLTMSGDPDSAAINAAQVWTKSEGCGFTAAYPLQNIVVAAYSGDCQKNGPGNPGLPLSVEVRHNADVIFPDAPLADGNVLLNLGDKSVSSPGGQVTGVNLMAASSQAGSFCVTFNGNGAYSVGGNAPTMTVN